MIESLFNASSNVGRLRAGLTGLMERFRGTTTRIANASEASSQQGDFLSAMDGIRPGKPVDVEAEMAVLADTALRYEAATQLMNMEFTAVRTAMRRDG